METTRSATWLVQCAAAVLPSILVAVSPHTIDAQQRPGPVRLDIGTGVFSGKGDSQFTDRSGFAISGQLTGRILSRASSSLLVAFNVSGFSNLNTTGDCVVPVTADGSGTCRPIYPSATVFALMVGLEQRLGNTVAFSLLAGPARFKSSRTDRGTGTQIRADLGFPANTHAAFVIWGQHAFMPVYQLPRERVPMLGIGIRIQ